MNNGGICLHSHVCVIFGLPAAPEGTKWDFGPFWLLLLFSDKTNGVEEEYLSVALGVDGTVWD